MSLYVLSLLFGIAYLASDVLGDSMHGLGVACFVLLVIAIVTDRRLGSS